MRHPPAELPTHPFRKAPVARGTLLPPACREALEHLHRAAAGGGEWVQALLEALGLWTLPQEALDGYHYTYLVAGEAFDWPLLALRLSSPVAEFLPPAERQALWERGEFPREVTLSEFKERIGHSKYRAALTFWYGVTVEQALPAAVEGAIWKERFSKGLRPRADLWKAIFPRLYGEGFLSLLQAFLHEADGARVALQPGEENRFTYWLFRQRLAHCKRERVASDTRKALEWLQRLYPDQLLTPLLSLRWSATTGPVWNAGGRLLSLSKNSSPRPLL